MRILICGTGIIGSIYALRFAKAGFSVTVLTRPERVGELRDNGITLRNALTGDEENARVDVVDHVERSDDFGIVFTAVRGSQIDEALSNVARIESAKAIAVIGNNIGDHKAQAEIAGTNRFVLGFGAFGGYREGSTIVYVDGRTQKKTEGRYITPTTLGILSENAHEAHSEVEKALKKAGLRCTVSGNIVSWLVCHAALVFPLAGAMYSAGGEQNRFCGTRDSIVLGVRACKELFASLKRIGFRMEPHSLKKLLATPEWILVPMLSRAFRKESARVAMFGHANATRGHSEISSLAKRLDSILHEPGREHPSWEKLLPYFENPPAIPLIPEGSKKIPLGFW